MKIKRPGRLTGIELALVSVIGIISGIYIWKPFFSKDTYKKLDIKEQSKSS